jgi:5-methylthioadenosine/S-adenosylhomocysteine deaminase
LVFPENDGGKRLAEALDLIDRWSGKAEREVPIHIHLAETKEEVV